MEHKTDDFTLVLGKIHQRERHNSVFFFTRELIEQNHALLNACTHQLIRRPETDTRALILHRIEQPNQDLLGYAVIDEHLTFDEWFLKGNAVLSPAHYRGLFQYGTKTLKIGVYFDQNGNEMLTHVALLSGDEEHAFPMTDPLLPSIKHSIKSHYLAYQALFLEIIQLKKAALLNINRETLEKDAQIVATFSESILDPSARTFFIESITQLIQDIRKRNSYDDEMQDLRYIQYEEILQDLVDLELIEEKEASSPTVATNQDNILSDLSMISVQELPSHHAQHVKIDKREKRKTHIVQLVENVLEEITSSGLANSSKHEQFIFFMKKLEKIECKCLGFLAYANQSDIQFIHAQKARLGFTTLSLDAYFSEQMKQGNLSALQALLPLISTSKRLAHYWNLMQAIINDKNGQASMLMCQTARFFYEHQEDFRQELLDCQNAFSCHRINGHALIQSPLMTLFLQNNLEGFRFFLTNNTAVHSSQFLIDDQQYHILDACILNYDSNKRAFIQALFEQGIQIEHDLLLLSTEAVKKMQSADLGKTQCIPGTTIQKKMVHATTRSHIKIKNSLDFAIESQCGSPDLINELALHTSLELLLTTVSNLLLNKDFALHLNLTNAYLLAAVENSKKRDEIMQTHAVDQDNCAIGCIFYAHKSTPTLDPRLFDTLQVLITIFQQQIVNNPIEKNRTIIEHLIQQAKEAQKQPDTQSDALIFVHAGLFAWLYIPSFGGIEDIEIGIRLLGLRGLLVSKLYPTHSNELALNTYKIGILYAQSFPQSTFMALQSQRSYQSLLFACKQLEARICARHEMGLFSGSGSTVTPSAISPVIKSSASCSHKTK